MRARAGALALTAVLSACGGGSSPQSPTPSPAPPITRGPVASVRGLVFYDEDGNGQPDDREVVATLIPANPAYESWMASARNDWIRATNAEIRAMASGEGVALADLHAAFLREDETLEPLFSDHVHPNDHGYSVTAAEFFRALTAPRAR